MHARFNDLSIAVKVAAAPLVVVICLLVAAAASFLTNQRTAPAIDLVVSQGLPNVVDTAALSERSTQANSLVMQSLAYEGAGMKPDLVAAIDQRIPEEFKAMRADIQRLKAASAQRPDALALCDSVEAAVVQLEKAAADTLDMKSGGLAGAALFMTTTGKGFCRPEGADRSPDPAGNRQRAPVRRIGCCGGGLGQPADGGPGLVRAAAVGAGHLDVRQAHHAAAEPGPGPGA